MTSEAGIKKRLTRAELLAQIQADKEKKRKKRLKIGGVVLVVFSLIMYVGLQPIKGPIQYGVCRAFLELQLKYPKTIRMTYVEIFDKSLRMYYTFTDSFGSTRSEMMECDFRPFNLLNLETVKRNRQVIDPAAVELFNKSVPAVVSVDMDLRIPMRPKGTIFELKND